MLTTHWDAAPQSYGIALSTQEYFFSAEALSKPVPPERSVEIDAEPLPRVEQDQALGVQDFVKRGQGMQRDNRCNATGVVR